MIINEIANAGHATEIVQNTADIAQNASDIAKNTTDIGTNTSNIAQNTTDIAQNTTDISTVSGRVNDVDSDITTIQNTVADKQEKLKAYTAVLDAAGWYENTIEVSITGMTETCLVWVCPSVDSIPVYTASGVTATSQGTGVLDFTCTTAPTEDIIINVAYGV